MIDADLIRGVITDHDRARPRSKQTAIGPSNLSSPCSRKLVYQILDVPKATSGSVNLMAWVGTAIHAQMETALTGDDDWLCEQQYTLNLDDGITITGSADAYHRPSKTVVDWKTVGPSALTKYRHASPDNYLTQVAIYGLMAVTAGLEVEHTALVYVPRNGSLSDIHVDVHPWDQQRAEAAIRRLEALHAAATAGPAALPLIPTADDCRFCEWWSPGSDRPEVACTGHPPTDVHGIPPWRPHNTQESASS